jgi:hypothetical protein
VKLPALADLRNYLPPLSDSIQFLGMTFLPSLKREKEKKFFWVEKGKNLVSTHCHRVLIQYNPRTKKRQEEKLKKLRFFGHLQIS